MSEERLRLLCAYDGSDAAAAAIRAAGALFPGSVATVVTVRDDPPVRDEGVLGRLALPDDTIARSLAELHAADDTAAWATAREGVDLAGGAGLAASPSVLTGGPPWRAVEAAAAGLPADVLVCGTHGRGAVARAVLGSTASSLLNAGSHPVLVTDGEAFDPDGPAVIGYDGSAGARDAVTFAAARLRPRPAIVTYVWRSPVRHSLEARVAEAIPVAEMRAFVEEYDEAFARAADDRAGEGAALAGGLGMDAEARAIESPQTPWHALLGLALDVSAAVVVVGTARQGPIASALAGSVAAGLVHHAGLPVLAVSPGAPPRPSGGAAPPPHR